MKTWIIASRPKTLVAAVVPIMVAICLVHSQGYPVNWSLSGLALLAALLIQIATNFFNDAIDFKKGADTNERLGPKRVTQSGDISFKKVMIAALLCCALAMAAGVPLVIAGGWPIIAVGLVSLFLAYAYTGGPAPLAYIGLGDLFVVLFFGLIAVGGVYYLNTKTYDLPTVIAGLQVGFLSTVLIVINNIRDVEQDKQVNKKTLVVRFGVPFSKIEVLVLYVLSFFLGIFWVSHEARFAFVLPFFAFSHAVRLVRLIFKTKPSEEYNKFLAKAAFIQIVFCVFLSIGLWLR